MTVKVFPSKISLSHAKGSHISPPSKSVLHRAIICAALANGETLLENTSLSNDIQATICAVRKLGAEVEILENRIKIRGIGGVCPCVPLSINCGESGSTLRFLIPILSALNVEACLVGQGALLSRPQCVYDEIYSKQGLLFSHTQDYIKIRGALSPCTYAVSGAISSQFISGLLLALPLLNGDSTIKITPPFESFPYVELTMQVMSKFGISVYFADDYTICIKGNQQYTPTDCAIEGDFSQAAFFAVLGAINGDITLTGLSPTSKQGDRKIIEILKSHGAKITSTADSFAVKSNTLTAKNIDISNIPDLGPILAVLLAFSKGRGTLQNASRLRIKESNRLEALQSELSKLNVDISIDGDSLTINGRLPLTSEVLVDSHNDHRIAMSLAIFAACAEFPITITRAECVAKSYPDFFADLQKIGVILSEYI